MTNRWVIAASPATGSNILDDESWAKVKNTCRIVAFGCSGGSAIHDGHFEIFYGQEKVADIYNNTTTMEAAHEDTRFWLSSNKRCVRGDSINVEVLSAAAANYYFWFDVKEG